LFGAPSQRKAPYPPEKMPPLCHSGLTPLLGSYDQ
jgi:hypothetical protein